VNKLLRLITDKEHHTPDNQTTRKQGALEGPLPNQPTRSEKLIIQVEGKLLDSQWTSTLLEYAKAYISHSSYFIAEHLLPTHCLQDLDRLTLAEAKATGQKGHDGLSMRTKTPLPHLLRPLSAVDETAGRTTQCVATILGDLRRRAWNLTDLMPRRIGIMAKQQASTLLARSFGIDTCV
jgi:hypothetical protein